MDKSETAAEIIREHESDLRRLGRRLHRLGDVLTVAGIVLIVATLAVLALTEVAR